MKVPLLPGDTVEYPNGQDAITQQDETEIELVCLRQIVKQGTCHPVAFLAGLSSQLPEDSVPGENVRASPGI